MNIKFDLLKKLPDGNEEDINWDNIAKPYPAKKVIPQWLRDQIGDFPDGGKSIKKCQPFLDGLTTGYIIPFPDDAYIRLEGKYDFAITGPGGRFLSSHGPDQYNNAWFKDRLVIKFGNPWIVTTPENYSSYVFHPNGTNTKPFYSIPAVIDTDCYYQTISIPFICTETRIGSELTIKKGTPMCQILPFKRETWNMEVGNSNFDLWQEENKKLWDDPTDYYLKNIKQKKDFS